MVPSSVDQALQKPKVLVLDVYETLLDMTPVEKKVNALLDNRRAYQFWFEMFMEYCFVDNCIDKFNPFEEIAKTTLQMAAHMFREKLSDHHVQETIDMLRSLPVKGGVQDGLSKLRDHDFRLAALTNSPHEVVQDRMSRTGLISYFEKVLSAEPVGKYKPSCAVYQWALKQLETKPEEAMMISTHGWDIAGAMNAGMSAAFVGDDDEQLYGLAPKPVASAQNLEELAEKITTLWDK